MSVSIPQVRGRVYSGKTVAPCRLATPDRIGVSQTVKLPAIPSLEIVLHSSLADPKTRETLRAITIAVREHRRARSKPVLPAPS